jgi:hypothetical protein
MTSAARVNEYAGQVQEAVELCGIIIEPVENQARAVESTITPTPPRTITQ